MHLAVLPTLFPLKGAGEVDTEPLKGFTNLPTGRRTYSPTSPTLAISRIILPDNTSLQYSGDHSSDPHVMLPELVKDNFIA